METADSGLMYAILNVDFSLINETCLKISNETNSIVSPANINSPNQVVISGNSEAVNLVITDLKKHGHKKNIKLNVTNAALRTVDFKGGLDKYLLSAKSTMLSKKVRKLKTSISSKA